ncbi:MAG: LLM class flavin-dependent oxidoreductase [Proteobacteria bacterium]|nr:LLM class flavin-dependent oxidoreductase [Pseudomonadota bacterium]
MDLPLDTGLTFGFQARMPTPDVAREVVTLAEKFGFASLSVGDHLAYAVPILDPLMQLACAAGLTRKLTMMPAVYLLPLRHPGPVAKQVATLDHMCGGRLIFGVGVGGEFASDFDVAGVPIKQRGARLSESIEVLRKLWTGEKVSHQGRFFAFTDIQMLPKPVQPGGPPIWCGGRSDAALRRIAQLADGWISYVVTADMYRAGMEKIATFAAEAGRRPTRFGTAHLLFARLGPTREAALAVATEHLSIRYAMDFSKPAARYCAAGRPADVAESIRAFHAAGVRTIVLDMIGPLEERAAQLQQFAEEVMPLLAGLR